jgi:SPP1 gp7 family putative phage head morphogenesis protein
LFTAEADNQPSEAYKKAVEEAVNRVLKDAYNSDYNAELASITAQELARITAKQYSSINADWNAPDTEMLQRLTRDVWQFSSAKNYQEMRDLTNLLKDENGELRSFSDFKNEASKVTDRYNENWMETEYNTAVSSSQNAARWTEFQKDKDVIPNLEYQTVGDSAVRAEHQVLDGIVKHIDDVFWASHYPPNGWGCRCEAVQTLETSTTPANKTPDIVIPKMFRTNLASDSLVFPKGHPYYVEIPQHVLVKTLKLIPTENAFRVDYYKDKPVLTHINHHAHELHNNSIISRKLIDNYKSISKVELLPDISSKEMELKKRFYPKTWHKQLDAKNADALIQIKGKDTIVEFKYLTGKGKHIKRHLEAAAEKSEYAVIMLTEESTLKKEWIKQKMDAWFLNTDKTHFKGLLIMDKDGKEVYKKSSLL